MDFSFTDFDTASMMISGELGAVIPHTIYFRIVNDLVPGEVENFRLELTNPQLVDASGEGFEVLIANSLTVDILDNDGRTGVVICCCLHLAIFYIFNFSN